MSPLETLKSWVGVQWGQFSSWGEGTSLALVGNPSSDSATIKILYAGIYPSTFDVL